MSNINMYQKMRTRQQEEFDTLPIKAAFGNEQFERMMKGFGLSPDKKKDLAQLIDIGCGCFILKKDYPKLAEMSGRHKRELKDAIAADNTGDGFIYDMFLYELCNHEYGYTCDMRDALMALGYSVSMINADKRLVHGLDKASKAILGGEA